MPIIFSRWTPLLPAHGLEDGLGFLTHVLQLLDGAHHRDHDLGDGVAALLDALGGGFGDGPHLELDQARDGQAEPDAPQAEHGVLLLQAPDGGQQALGLLVHLARGPGHRGPHGQLGEVGQELVQRWVDQAHGDGQPVHLLEDGVEIGSLQGQEGVEGGLALLVGLGQDQLLDQLAPLAQEHVLGAGQADTLGPVQPCPAGVLGHVGIGPNEQPAAGVGVAQDALDRGHQVSGSRCRPSRRRRCLRRTGPGGRPRRAWRPGTRPRSCRLWI